MSPLGFVPPGLAALALILNCNTPPPQDHFLAGDPAHPGLSNFAQAPILRPFAGSGPTGSTRVQPCLPHGPKSAQMPVLQGFRGVWPRAFLCERTRQNALARPFRPRLRASVRERIWHGFSHRALYHICRAVWRFPPRRVRGDGEGVRTRVVPRPDARDVKRGRR